MNSALQLSALSVCVQADGTGTRRHFQRQQDGIQSPVCSRSSRLTQLMTRPLRRLYDRPPGSWCALQMSALDDHCRSAGDHLPRGCSIFSQGDYTSGLDIAKGPISCAAERRGSYITQANVDEMKNSSNPSDISPSAGTEVETKIGTRSGTPANDWWR